MADDLNQQLVQPTIPFSHHAVHREHPFHHRLDQAIHADQFAHVCSNVARLTERRLKRGLNTIVGERGMLISGGERQRIALARAILRKPHHPVLDEATGAMDVKSEYEILVWMLAMQPRMTIVMIAYRAESLALCSRVLRLESSNFASVAEYGAPSINGLMVRTGFVDLPAERYIALSHQSWHPVRREIQIIP